MDTLEYLIELLRNELNITWDDNETSIKLSRIVRNATSSLNYKIGADIDYSESGQEQELLITYCVYLYNNVSNEFDANYFNDIMQLRHKYEVKQYEDSLNEE